MDTTIQSSTTAALARRPTLKLFLILLAALAGTLPVQLLRPADSDASTASAKSANVLASPLAGRTTSTTAAGGGGALVASPIAASSAAKERGAGRDELARRMGLMSNGSFGSYVKCVAGIGVPIGAVWALWPYAVAIARGASLPPGMVPYSRYVRAIYNNCRWFILYG